MPRDHITQEVIDMLREIYSGSLSQIEKDYKFSEFQYDTITDAELNAKPQVLVIGQYSVGKTTFVRYLLGEDFPCMVIGPEPTTDKFTAVMHGRESQAVHGHSVAAIKDLPFEGVAQLGAEFLAHFELSLAPAELLRSLTLVDTPGMLAGAEERVRRGYDLPSAVRWFADRSDLVLVMFDSHKFDLSREMRETLIALRGREAKLRFLLNKADQPAPQELIRCYGHLMRRLSGLVDAIESKYVYVGSFWDRRKDTWEVFENDEEKLVTELYQLPRSSTVRKINDFIVRIKRLKTHIRILSYLKSCMPKYFFHEAAQFYITTQLPHIFEKIKSHYELTDSDMPDITEFRKVLHLLHLEDIPVASRKTLRRLDAIVDQKFPLIFQKVNAITSAFELKPVPRELRSSHSGRWEYRELPHRHGGGRSRAVSAAAAWAANGGGGAKQVTFDTKDIKSGVESNTTNGNTPRGILKKPEVTESNISMDTSTLSRKNSASSDDGSTGSSATLGRLYDDKLLLRQDHTIRNLCWSAVLILGTFLVLAGLARWMCPPMAGAAAAAACRAGLPFPARAAAALAEALWGVAAAAARVGAAGSGEGDSAVVRGEEETAATYDILDFA